ncbi:MAG TPA: ankyrin repeat domain-containing protein [Vicinamibacterales bacterium]|nr:ankyrin repeat domain-containing protein [Vicinamibacterales bacterium]
MKLLIALTAALALLQPAPLTKAEQLQEAARKGDAVAVKKLLDEGVDVNTKFRYGATALFYACDHGNLEVVKVLLDKGADMSLKDTFYGFTPLALAVSPAQKKKPEHAEIARLLIMKGAPGRENALGPALQSGDLALAKVILDAGVADQAKTDALETAKALNKPDVVTLLENSGAKPYEEFKMDDAQLARFSGTYRLSNGPNEVVITAGKGRLIGTPVGGPPSQLSPRDAKTFRLIGQSGATLTFSMDGDKVTGFALSGPGRPTVTYNRVEGK